MELQAPVIESSTNPSTKNGVFVSSVKEKPDQLQQSPAPSIAGPSLLTNKISSTIADKVDAATSETEAPSVNYRSCSSRSSSDVLEKARAAIAWADRASAAELVKPIPPRISFRLSSLWSLALTFRLGCICPIVLHYRRPLRFICLRRRARLRRKRKDEVGGSGRGSREDGVRDEAGSGARA
ncbi:hypothetical protein BHE74_00025699 [Ensete ventricosum]|nr:hypothetical protein GW17_00011390 [Ensete ventricosum]RWW66899.1 hypothetical protein BHE74_00025699 [Ensete ventricosum]